MATDTVFALNPESPDATQGGLSVSGLINSGHGLTSVNINPGPANIQRTARWFNYVYSPLGRMISSITLQFNWSVDGSIDDPFSAVNLFRVEYTLDGGSNWPDAIVRTNLNGSDGGSFSLPLSVGQNIGQVQVRDIILAGADEGFSASIQATITGLQIVAVTFDNPNPIVMM
jgi:hypothetical protein